MLTTETSKELIMTTDLDPDSEDNNINISISTTSASQLKNSSSGPSDNFNVIIIVVISIAVCLGGIVIVHVIISSRQRKRKATLRDNKQLRFDVNHSNVPDINRINTYNHNNHMHITAGMVTAGGNQSQAVVVAAADTNDDDDDDTRNEKVKNNGKVNNKDDSTLNRFDTERLFEVYNNMDSDGITPNGMDCIDENAVLDVDADEDYKDAVSIGITSDMQMTKTKSGEVSGRFLNGLGESGLAESDATISFVKGEIEGINIDINIDEDVNADGSYNYDYSSNGNKAVASVDAWTAETVSKWLKQKLVNAKIDSLLIDKFMSEWDKQRITGKVLIICKQDKESLQDFKEQINQNGNIDGFISAWTVVKYEIRNLKI